MLGIAGAYLRYLFSPLNKIYRSFPLGTFIVNVLGTWIAAMITTISKFGVEYYDISTQAVLYGILVGFCGCLTTVSTFVAELDDLPAASSYSYSLYSNAAAQFGIIFIYNVYAYGTVPQSSVIMTPIDLCSASENLCGNLLDKLGCPEYLKVNTACDESGSYDSYQGLCQCGQFDTVITIKFILDLTL